MLAAARDRRVEQDLAHRILDRQRAGRLGDVDGDLRVRRPRRPHRRRAASSAAARRRLGRGHLDHLDIRHHDLFARPVERRTRIQLLQQRRARVKFFSDGFERCAVVQRLQLRLFDDIGRDVRCERTADVLGGQGVGHERGLTAGRETFPCGRINSSTFRKAVRALKRDDGAAHVAPGAPVDLARRETRAIEHDLRGRDIVDHRRL